MLDALTPPTPRGVSGSGSAATSLSITDNSEKAAEDAVEEFSEYEDFADAIDAFAQAQNVKGNEAQMESDAEERAGLATDETDRAAVLREHGVRHEVRQALHGLLGKYGHQPRQSFGVDSNAQQDE